MDINTVFRYENDIGSITFSHASPFWLTEVSGASGVQVALQENQSTGQVGSTIAAQNVQPRTLSLDGVLFGALSENRKKLIEVVAPGVASRLVKLDGADTFYLEVVPTRTPDIAPGQGCQNFQLQLQAAYPYWRSTTTAATQLTGLEAKFAFAFFTGAAFQLSKFTESFYCNVHNAGNVPLEFELVFAAAAELKNPEVYHMGTGQRIGLAKTMAPGEVAFIFTVKGQKRVTITNANGTTENGFRYLEADSDLAMVLLAGTNLLRADAAENRERLNTVIHAPKGVLSGV